jgi:SWI/SNF-related matrix-associated actin-dependent regulator 1 of chromatin subfamily A
MNRDICCPFGLSYFPYQVEGIEFALQRNGVLLADEMGLGKSIQVIGIINALGYQINRILIVCPATMRLVWRDELFRWLVRRLSVGVAGVDPVSEQILARVHVLIVNYDRLQRMERLVTTRQWDLAILDECHLVKNPDAKRSEVAFKIQAARRLGLSGTPLPNRPIELYPILSWLDPGRWPASSRFEFATRYCAARHTSFGWDLSGSSNTAALGELLRSSVMIRRTKAEVLPQLPPKLRRVVEMTPSSDLKTLVDRELAAFERWQKQAGQDSGTSIKGGQKPFANVSVLPPRGLDWEKFSSARLTLALAKVPLVAGFVRETLEAMAGKVTIFAHHRTMIHRLEEALQFAGPVLLYGGMTPLQRQASIDSFQHNAACRVFIGQIQAAGLGITLAPASNHCIFAELSWVPSDLIQAEDRLHRLGAKDNVLVQHLVLRGSLDAIMVRRLIKKQEVLDGVLSPAVSSAEVSVGA